MTCRQHCELRIVDCGLRHGLVRSLVVALFFLLTACCLLPTAFGQSATATISGTVEDQNGALVPGAIITVTNVATVLKRETTSNEAGQFTVPLLPPGNYIVNIEHDGFARAEIRNVVLNVGDQKTMRIELKVGDVKSEVQVTPDAQLISESPAVSTVIDRTFVENLPLNGRGFNALLELTPGVTLTKTSVQAQGQFIVNGQRATSNYFSVDGVSANTGVSVGSGLKPGPAGTLPATSVLGGLNALVSVDALQEFRVLTSSFAPENGRTPGAQILVATRSGTNQFHGDLFEYFRNDKLDANDWFANSIAKPRSALRQNDFGGVVSGPILLPRFGEGGKQPGYNGRDRTFFFFSYEGLRLVQPQTIVGNSVPSLAARQAAPAAIQPYLNAFPLPTGPTLANGFARLDASFSTPSNFDATSIRVDHQLGGTALFVRFADSPSSTQVRGGATSLNSVNFSTLVMRSFTAGATSAISSSISNDFRFNWTGTTGATIFRLDNFGGAQVPPPNLFFPSYSSQEEGVFTINLVGPGATFQVGKNSITRQRQWNVVDTVSLKRGPHDLKAGVDARILLPVIDSYRNNVSVNFSSVGDPSAATIPPGTALSGIASSGSVGTLTPNFGLLYANWSLFVQDTWKVSARLTATYGLRWDIVPPPKARNGLTLLAANRVDDVSQLAFAPEGTRLWPTRYGNLAPRVGLAFALRRSRDFALMLRAGVGTFFDITSGGFVGSGQQSTAPFGNTRSFTLVPFPYSSATVAAPLLPPTPPYTMTWLADPNLATARTYQWNVALEQALGRSRSLTATYVGAKGSNLARTTNFINPNPQFRAANLTLSDGSSNYQALQLQFHGQIRQVLSALASYTWSHSIDNVSVETASTTPSVSLNRAASDFDVRQSFSAGFTFSPRVRKGSFWSPLLGGWGIDAIMQARSAFPVNISVSRDIGFGTYLFRPDLVTGIPLYIDNPNVAGGRQFNNVRVTGTNQVGPFLIPAALRQGNLERNALRGLAMYQADLAVRREFRLRESLKLQFRGELFNVTNHPNFGDPSGLLGTLSTTGAFSFSQTTFGLSTLMLGRQLSPTGAGLSSLYQVGGPRSIQLSLKLVF